jgi:hypothetical protein
MHLRTDYKNAGGIEAETKKGIDRGRDGEMIESTAKRLKERIHAGMDQTKGAEIEEGMEERSGEIKA